MTQAPLRLEVASLSKTYGAVRALSDASLQLRPGEVMALLGENGAGKSTLVKVLSGLVGPDSGTVRVDGRDVDLSSTAKSQAAGIAVVQQEYSSVGTMTVAENFALGRRDAGWFWGRHRLARAALPYLEQVGLGHLDPHQLVETLSVAELQLLEIARVLARDARIVIFDEPTAALSDKEIEAVLAVITSLASSGISVIYVTHRLPEVFEIADRVTVFRNGRSSQPVEVADVSLDAVIAMMLGRQLDTMYPARPVGLGQARVSVSALDVPGLRQPVELTVRRGEILGLTGQLGSGAHLLLRALAGLIPALGGGVQVDGVPLDLRNRRAGIAAGVGYCTADRKKDGIFAELSITRNLSSPWISRVAPAGVISGGRERTAASRIAARFAIDADRLGSPVGVLSGGNQQKVAFGKWLGIAPKVLLVEEPTRGVDVGARAEIYENLRELCADGMTVIVSSSDSAEVFGLADTIATFYHGEMTAVRPYGEWSEADLIRMVMHRSAA